MYPINLFLSARPCLVIGGGNVALQKVQGLLAAQAQVTIISPLLCHELRLLADSGQVHWQKKEYTDGDVKAFDLLICAADNQAVNRAAAAEARRRRILVNVCDVPAISDFAAPAVIRRGDLLITIGTSGKSPALSRYFRRVLAAEIGAGYGLFLERLVQLRREARQTLKTPQERQQFWRQALTDDVMALVAAGNIDAAEARLRHAIDRYRFE